MGCEVCDKEGPQWLLVHDRGMMGGKVKGFEGGEIILVVIYHF